MRPPIMSVPYYSEPRSLPRRMFGDHRSLDPAPHVENSLDPHAAGRESLHQVVEDAVGHRLVKVPLVAKRPEIELERLELDAESVRHVLDLERAEVGLP